MSMTPAPWLAEALRLGRTGLPLGLANLAGIAMVSTDLAFLGRAGSTAMAGGALAFAMHALLLQIATGYLYAIGPALGRALGAKREEEIMPTMRAAALTLTAYAALAAVVYFQSGAILVGLGQDAAASGEAQRFLRVAAAGLPFGIGFVMLSEFLVAHELGDDIFKVTLVGVALNFALDGVLMSGWLGGLRLEAPGCATATAISSAAMFAILLARSWPLLRKYAALGGAQRRSTPIGDLLRDGAPLAALEVLLFLFFTQMTLFIGHMGVAPLNAHSAVSQVTDVLMYMVFGFGEALATRMAFLIGRGDARAVHAGVRAHLAFSWALGAVAALGLIVNRPGFRGGRLV
jgi:MATE family multidrug resistance protein